MNQIQETCSICGCEVHRSGEYAKPTVLGRSHATKHHFVAERFFGRSGSRPGSERERIFPGCPWGFEGATGVFCYECHEELLHNPVLLPGEVKALAELVRWRGLSEETKPPHREKIAGRIKLLHAAIATGIKILRSLEVDTEEITTLDGCEIRRDRGYDPFTYMAYNVKYFGGNLPNLPVYWASKILLPDKHSAIALFIPAKAASDGHPFIVLSEKLRDVSPLDGLSLIHEMVHVKMEMMDQTGETSGHPEAFVQELQRVLNLDRWKLMGCDDESGRSDTVRPKQEPQK
jgi:hypothetical protein